jgi:hypothetical protein
MALRGVPLKLRFNEGIFRPKRKTGCPGQDFLVPFGRAAIRRLPKGTRREAKPNLDMHANAARKTDPDAS